MKIPACLIDIEGYCTLDQDGIPGYVLSSLDIFRKNTDWSIL